MVLQDHIDNLLERPHHERRAVAAAVALGVVAVLFVGWFAFFIHGLGSGQPVQAAAAPAATASAAQSVVAPSSQTLQWDATSAATLQGTSSSAPSQ